MCQVAWRSAYKRTLPNSVLTEGTAIGESYMMELYSEMEIISCSVVYPWMKSVKDDFFPVLAAFLQPRYFLLLLLFGTILRLSLHPSLAFLLWLHSRHRV